MSLSLLGRDTHLGWVFVLPADRRRHSWCAIYSVGPEQVSDALVAELAAAVATRPGEEPGPILCHPVRSGPLRVPAQIGQRRTR
jgi:hypothetical protein